MIRYIDRLKKFSNMKLNLYEQLDGNEKEIWTYEDFIRDMGRCATCLEESFGNIAGKHFGIIAHSDYEYFVLLGAIIFSRAVVIPLNERETLDNLSFAISNSNLDGLIVSEDFLSYEFENVIIINKSELFKTDAEEKELQDFEDEEANTLSLIINTSGTTSLSKGVALTAYNLFHDYKNMLLPQQYVYDGMNEINPRVYINTPFFHVAGILAFLILPMNASTICCSKNPANVLDDLAVNYVDYSVVIPATLKLWETSIRRGNIDKLGGAGVIETGGAALDQKMVEFFFDNGIKVVQFYGMTEVGGVITVNHDMDTHPNSVGKPVDGAEVLVKDGELCISFWGNMSGYYNDPEETKKTLIDGVIYSGDLGYIDEEGYVYVTGRKKNLIILSGGENVSPEEIESYIYKNPQIKECLVYESSDRIVADIYAPDLTQKELKEFIDRLNSTLPIYKRIYRAALKKDELEKTSSGKVKR